MGKWGVGSASDKELEIDRLGGRTVLDAYGRWGDYDRLNGVHRLDL